MKGEGGRGERRGERGEGVVSGQGSAVSKTSSVHHSSFLIPPIPNPQSPIPNPPSPFPFPPPQRPLSILLLGNLDRTEFRDARSCLDRWGAVHGFTEVAAAAAALAEGEAVPDAIVVAQAFPGQFSHQMIDRLRRLAPLARVVGLMGSWCEGEMRTGLPWPGVVRTYWHQWAARSYRELRRLAGGEHCPWALPPTATEEERLLADARLHQQRPHPNPLRAPTEGWSGEGTKQCRGLVVICAGSHEMAQWLSAACRSREFATVWQRPPTAARVEGATAAIFDGADLGQDQSSELNRLAAALHPAPVVVLLAFPRVEDRRRALSAGATAVISKPLAVEDLFWELERGERGERREEREL